MSVNRLYLVVVSQGAPDESWAPIWGGQGGVRVYALDRERCLLPVEFDRFSELMNRQSEPGPLWDQVPPRMEPSDDGRSSRLAPA